MQYFGEEYVGSRGSTPISGIRNVLRNINREIDKVKGRTLTGLIKAAALIHNETETGAVRVPVDTGNLRHSWFVVTSAGKIVSGGGRSKVVDGGAASFTGASAGTMAADHSAMIKEMRMRAWAFSEINDGPFVFFGYSANYAVYVHEMIDVGPWDPSTKTGFRRKKSGPKWFEIALNKHQDNIVSIIRKNAKIK